MEQNEPDPTPPRLPDEHVRPPLEAIRRAAEVLAGAKSPGILVGNRVCEAGAVDALVAVAERLGAAVIHEAYTSHGRSSFPSDHPLAAGLLPFWSQRSYITCPLLSVTFSSRRNSTYSLLVVW